jgi:hypothetical protein
MLLQQHHFFQPANSLLLKYLYSNAALFCVQFLGSLSQAQPAASSTTAAQLLKA